MNTNQKSSHLPKKKENTLQENQNASNEIQNNNNNGNILAKWKFPVLFVILFLIILGLLASKLYFPHPIAVTTKTIIKQTIVQRSKNLGYVARGLTGNAVDVNTGKVVRAARIFTANDKKVYLEVDLNNAPKGLVLDYLRYRNGKYVDHGAVTITKIATNNVLFSWIINAVFSNIRDGNWKVVIYTQGVLSKRLNYQVKNSKFSFVSPDSEISPKDKDYRLNNALSLASK